MLDYNSKTQMNEIAEKHHNESSSTSTKGGVQVTNPVVGSYVTAGRAVGAGVELELPPVGVLLGFVLFAAIPQQNEKHGQKR